MLFYSVKLEVTVIPSRRRLAVVLIDIIIICVMCHSLVKIYSALLSEAVQLFAEPWSLVIS